MPLIEVDSCAFLLNVTLQWGRFKRHFKRLCSQHCSVCGLWLL